ncbi:hypothetical protein EVAR_65949_1 [Eumeta japonica]|uniref:Uncharacterized protein n=1 Tax=Eumeta variegata TaxID=151549 RepID=A0A4C1ZIH4_EUMVA|nr:hypothetical protein EVAR_65949_1 [Eumeta japonica]
MSLSVVPDSESRLGDDGGAVTVTVFGKSNGIERAIDERQILECALIKFQSSIASCVEETHRISSEKHESHILFNIAGALWRCGVQLIIREAQKAPLSDPETHCAVANCKDPAARAPPAQLKRNQRGNERFVRARAAAAAGAGAVGFSNTNTLFIELVSDETLARYVESRNSRVLDVITDAVTVIVNNSRSARILEHDPRLRRLPSISVHGASKEDFVSKINSSGVVTTFCGGA